jgi:hypothetical protein
MSWRAVKNNWITIGTIQGVGSKRNWENKVSKPPTTSHKLLTLQSKWLLGMRVWSLKDCKQDPRIWFEISTHFLKTSPLDKIHSTFKIKKNKKTSLGAFSY